MIDKYIKRPWPDKVGKALADIRQGDVVKAPPFFYAHGGDIRLWEVADDEAGQDDAAHAGSPVDDGAGYNADEDEVDEDEVEEDWDDDEDGDDASRVEEIYRADAPPLGIITSQTCDLDEQGAKPSQVWFQVSPVYAIPEEPDDRNRLLSRQFTVKLNGPDLPPGDWVADLRIELPIEKSWLVKKKRARGFAAEADAEKFGVKIGRRRARPALANELVDNITSSIRKRKQVKGPADLKKVTREIWNNDVYRVMLAIEGGTRLKPAAVQLHVLCPAEPTTRVQGWFGDWEDSARSQAKAVGIELMMTRVHDARKVDLQQYDRWVELDFR